MLIAAIALLPVACKKETMEIKKTKAPATAQKSNCSGNIWNFDNFFDGHKKNLPGLATVYTMPIVYNNKIYVFDPDKDEIRFYDGTSWNSIQSEIPFDNPVNIGFTLGNKGYLMPVYGSADGEVWEYNFAANTWTKKADFPGPFRNGWSASIFTIGDKGYIAGGTLYGNYFNDTWEYNQSANTWTKKANFSFIGIAGAAGFSIGNKGYIVNGFFHWPNIGTIYSKILKEYDPVTNVWSFKASFPGEARGGSKVFVIAGAAYVGGGSSNGKSYNDYYKYTPGTNSWVKIADAPVSSIPYFGFSINSKGYIVFHADSNRRLPDEQYIYKYTPLTCISPPGPTPF